MPGVVRRKADFSELRLFWAVAEAGSFGAAARALGVSTSTLTRAVDNLEARLGVRLLTRTTQGVTLTQAGQTAFDRVETMERAAAALELELAGLDESPRGVVKLSAPDGIAGVFLTPTMPDFMRAHPEIDLAIDCGLWPDQPLKGDVDLALTFQKPDQDEAIAKPLAYLHYDLFAAQSYVDLYGQPRTMQEALTHPYVHHAAQVYQMTGEANAVQAMMRARLQTNSSAASFNAIREGVGIGALPTASLCFDPTLVKLGVTQHGPITMWLSYRRPTRRGADQAHDRLAGRGLRPEDAALVPQGIHRARGLPAGAPALFRAPRADRRHARRPALARLSHMPIYNVLIILSFRARSI